jgi:5,10-methylenetetrahydromethanopterin reductase
MVLGLTASRTSDIGLGPASLVPSLRHPMVTAAALGTLAGLAPGRVSAAFGTGLTGRMLLGERPMRWAEVEHYVEAVRALLRGEEISWEGSPVRMSRPGSATACSARSPGRPGGRQVALTFGTVLDVRENPASPRVIAAAVDKLPGGRDWREAVVPRKATFLGR